MATQYCTEAELIEGGLREAVIDELATRGISVTSIIERASARIDSYLRGRYSLPLAAPAPREVADVCIQLALWYALSALGFDAQTGPDQSAMMGYQEATSWLTKVSTGRANLAVSVDATPTANDGAPIVRSVARECGIRDDRRVGGF